MQSSVTSNHVAALYRFCAQSMQYPDSKWLNEKYMKSLLLLLSELRAVEERDQLQSAFNESHDFLEDLQIEHTRLFINGVPHVAAPPYGSVYLEKTLRGKYSEEVFLFYQNNGFMLTGEADLPDNIIHQLEFLSCIAEDNNQSAEEEFLSRFFLPWFSIFAARVKEEAQHPFYSIIISLIDFFTKEEK